MSDLISIIVPVYNIAEYLPQCLDSICAQTYSNIEIIAVNDGSTDNSLAVLRYKAEMDGRIKVIDKPNGGVTSARLAGIEAAKGTWIGFVDGDDELEPDMYERLLRNAIEYDADISHCGHQVHHLDGSIEFLYNTGRFVKQSSEEALKELLNGSFEPGLWNKLYNKTLLHSLFHSRVMDASIKQFEDLLMNYCLFREANTIVFEDFCPYHYLKREGSASDGKSVKSIWDPITVKKRILDDCVGSSLENVARAAYLGICLIEYNGLAGNQEYYDEKIRIFDLINEHAMDVQYLSADRARCVKLLLKAPWLYDLLRGIYKRVR